MQEEQYEKIRILFLNLIQETKELTQEEFENIINLVFKENQTFTPEVKERLAIDITKMRNEIIKLK